MNRIGIYTLVAPPEQGGVGRQLAGLLAGLQQVDLTNEYLLFTSRSRLPGLAAMAPNFRAIPLRVTPRRRLLNHLFQALALPIVAARRGVDLLHVPNSMPLLYGLRPTIVTIYDLTEFALPERVYGRGRHAYRRLANRLAARRADAIITTSASTRRDIRRYLGVPPSRIQVIYPGVDERFSPETPGTARVEALRRRYQLPGRFALYVGKIQPRKNLVRIVQALAEVRRSHPDLHLVVAGRRGWLERDIYATATALALEKVICFTGFVADSDLPDLYRLAEMLIFPSLYEGFGFPVIEAMASGLPVVASSTSSLGEIAGEAALAIEPRDVGAIAAAMRQLLSDAATRETLRARGLRRAADFSWTRCAAQTRDLYQSLVGGHGRSA